MDRGTTQYTIDELFKMIDEEKFLNVINDVTIDRYVKKARASGVLLIVV